ncbi:MAG: hypothetical protein IPK34_17370 [Ramlibacter sp.]|nr:hypothetical protein [Ramlibacter sp.]
MKHYTPAPPTPCARSSTQAPLPGAALRWACADGVGTVTLNRPGAQEPADVRLLCRAARLVPGAARATDVKAVVVTGAGGNFCSGGDVHEIIGPLTRR